MMPFLTPALQANLLDDVAYDDQLQQQLIFFSFSGIERMVPMAGNALWLLKPPCIEAQNNNSCGMILIMISPRNFVSSILQSWIIYHISTHLCCNVSCSTEFFGSWHHQPIETHSKGSTKHLWFCWHDKTGLSLHVATGCSHFGPTIWGDEHRCH